MHYTSHVDSSHKQGRRQFGASISRESVTRDLDRARQSLSSCCLSEDAAHDTVSPCDQNCCAVAESRAGLSDHVMFYSAQLPVGVRLPSTPIHVYGWIVRMWLTEHIESFDSQFSSLASSVVEFFAGVSSRRQRA